MSAITKESLQEAVIAYGAAQIAVGRCRQLGLHPDTSDIANDAVAKSNTAFAAVLGCGVSARQVGAVDKREMVRDGR